METTAFDFHGFQGVEFTFEGNNAKLVRPNVTPNGKWALKTEYFGAFPQVEIELLKRGWHIAYNQNDNRWAEKADLERKGAFIRFVAKTFHLQEKCALVGMSCGGLYAVKTSAIFPELISALYLDAPVMNLLSCPFGLSGQNDVVNMPEEYLRCTGRTLQEMLSYREHPIDKMHVLLEKGLPIVLVSGDSDTVVPYAENGALLEKYYKENGGVIEVYMKAGGDHHPHGLPDPAPIVAFLEKYTK